MGKASRKRRAAVGFQPHRAGHNLVYFGYRMLPGRRERSEAFCTNCPLASGRGSFGYRLISRTVQLPRGGYHGPRVQRALANRVPQPRPDTTLIQP